MEPRKTVVRGKKVLNSHVPSTFVRQQPRPKKKVSKSVIIKWKSTIRKRCKTCGS